MAEEDELNGDEEEADEDLDLWGDGDEEDTDENLSEEFESENFE